MKESSQVPETIFQSGAFNSAAEEHKKTKNRLTLNEVVGRFDLRHRINPGVLRSSGFVRTGF